MIIFIRCIISQWLRVNTLLLWIIFLSMRKKSLSETITCTVRSGPMDPQKCTYHAEGLVKGSTFKAKAGVETEFFVTLRDSYGNLLDNEDLSYHGNDVKHPICCNLIPHLVTIDPYKMTRQNPGVYRISFLATVACRIEVRLEAKDPVTPDRYVSFKDCPWWCEMEAAAGMKFCRTMIMPGAPVIQICQKCFNSTERNKCFRCRRALFASTVNGTPRYCLGCSSKWRQKCLLCKTFIHFNPATPGLCAQCSIAEANKCGGYV